MSEKHDIKKVWQKLCIILTEKKKFSLDKLTLNNRINVSWMNVGVKCHSVTFLPRAVFVIQLMTMAPWSPQFKN